MIVVLDDVVELPPLTVVADVDEVWAVVPELADENIEPDCASVIVGIVTPSVLSVV